MLKFIVRTKSIRNHENKEHLWEIWHKASKGRIEHWEIAQWKWV